MAYEWLASSWPSCTIWSPISGCASIQMPDKKNVACTPCERSVSSTRWAGSTGPPASNVSATTLVSGSPWTISVQSAAGCAAAGRVTTCAAVAAAIMSTQARAIHLPRKLTRGFVPGRHVLGLL